MGGPGSRRPPNRGNGAGRGPSGPAGRAPRSLPPPIGGGSCLLTLLLLPVFLLVAFARIRRSDVEAILRGDVPESVAS